MKKNAFFIAALLSLASCGAETPASSSFTCVVPEGGFTYREYEYNFPAPEKQGERIRFTASFAVRHYNPQGVENMTGQIGEMQYLWGDYALPDFWADWIKKSNLLPGNVFSFDIECEGVFILDTIPLQIRPIHGTVYSGTVTKGKMVEVPVENGEVKYCDAGLNYPCILTYEKDRHLFEYAVAENGTCVPVSELSKVYVGVSVEDPTMPLGLMAYPFQ